MDFIIDNLTPETISFIEQSYGSLQLWFEAATDWTAEQIEALQTIIVEDVHI